MCAPNGEQAQHKDAHLDHTVEQKTKHSVGFSTAAGIFDGEIKYKLPEHVAHVTRNRVEEGDDGACTSSARKIAVKTK